MRGPALLLLVLSAVFVGCESGVPAPEIYPVRGVVLGIDGAPAKGGMVEFRATEEPFTVATGPIAKDGTFVLASIFEERRLEGVPAGTFRVTVLPDFSGSAQDQHLAQPTVLPDPVSVSSSGENAFKIDLRDAKK